ncbi:MAG TPA: ribosomal-processing cysteine protease Prp [Clostridia bacterium]|nr:ribosomal-processing cysteine protease Prp [Clostridia bacterium]
MIRIEIGKNSKGDIYKFSIKGHAGYGEYGKDIVCAAVSAISQTAILGLENLRSVKIKKKIREGDLEVVIVEKGCEEDNIRLNAILETMVMGLKDIAEDYPIHVKVIEEEV